MRILVTGPRQWTDEKTLHDALFSVFIAHAPFAAAEVTLVHGGADGFDLISAAKAAELGWETEEHKPTGHRIVTRPGLPGMQRWWRQERMSA